MRFTPARLVGATVFVATALAVSACGAKPTAAPNPQSSEPTAAHTPTASTTPLAVGAAPAVPYAVGPHVYVDGRALRGVNGVDSVHGATAVISLGNSEAGDTTRYEVLRSSRTVARFTARTVVVSRDGSKVAYLDGTATHLVELLATTGREIGRTSVDAKVLGHQGEENEGWENLEAVQDDGTVWFGSVAASHDWKPGQPPYDVALRNGGPPAGFPWRSGWDISLSPTTDWGAWITNRTGHTNARGVEKWVNDGVTLQRKGRPATRTTIALPHGFNAGGLTWESATALLVEASDDPAQTHFVYLRCDITTKVCEHAPTAADR